MSRLGYVPALDGLRGIAIFLVVGFHDFGIPPGGAVGVDLFFVLSGFLITTLLLEEHLLAGRVSLRRFYNRRARRLFPALAVMVCLFLLAAAARGEDWITAATVGVSYAGNLLIAYGITPVLNHSPVAPLWSLAEEEQFYLLWPCLLVLLVRSRRMVTWIAVLAVGLAVYRAALFLHGSSATRLYFGLDTHADGLVAGCLLAAIRFRSGLRVGERVGKAGVLIVCGAAVFSGIVAGWEAWGMPLVEIGSVCLIAAAVSQTALAQGLSIRPLVWLGKRSYSLYLWHAPALWLVHPLLPRVAAAGLALICANLSFRYVEQPFRRRHARLAPAVAAR